MKLAEKIIDMHEVKKSKSASKVLKMMDSEEGGDAKFKEFVAKVAKEDGISVEQLEKELEPFI